MSQEIEQTFSCRCGHARVSVSGVPLARFYCHCRICQSLYKAPFADVLVFRRNGFTLPGEGALDFRRYRMPPALRRGTCARCGQPMAGFLKLLPGLELGFTSAGHFPDPERLPQPRQHIFYHRRQNDIADDLPKIGGYWRSECAVTRQVLAGLRA